MTDGSKRGSIGRTREGIRLVEKQTQEKKNER